MLKKTAYERMLCFLKSDESNKFSRENQKRHFTGSGLVVDMQENKGLLNHHKFLDLWLCFGGHADGNPDLYDVAYRETIEESGLKKVKAYSTEIFDLDIHDIPERQAKNEPPHQHYDILWLFEASIHDPIEISHESCAVQWMSVEEAKNISGCDTRMLRILDKWQTLQLKTQAA